MWHPAPPFWMDGCRPRNNNRAGLWRWGPGAFCNPWLCPCRPAAVLAAEGGDGSRCSAAVVAVAAARGGSRPRTAFVRRAVCVRVCGAAGQRVSPSSLPKAWRSGPLGVAGALAAHGVVCGVAAIWHLGTARKPEFAFAHNLWPRTWLAILAFCLNSERGTRDTATVHGVRSLAAF